MKFGFKFEKILGLKEKLEDNKKNEMAIISNSIRDLENEISKMEEMKRERYDILEETLMSGASITDIKNISYSIECADISIERLQQKLSSLRESFNFKKVEYLEVMKERKSFEKLKEKHIDEFKQVLKLNEEKALDQINTFRIRGTS
ncbi:MAG: flagellar export protein FliJ [Peptoclostridium sp.]|uniref:flagellar export protein FliJ n=1 Tax=Peptoclostridium sp. TaxID=1904860 RepID=UPI00139EE5C0|nr:flagellar export protein FliJ [Peptoclostridium sp.]MZQ75124.1 flagellar export protein FliJ [Peptoclostridium sp.]